MAPPPPPPPAGGYPAAPPPPSGPGGYQTYQPGPEGRVIPEIGAYQDEPWKRIVARIIDGVILMIPNFILASIFLTVDLNDCLRGTFTVVCSISTVNYFLYGLTALILNGAFYIGFVAFMGTTPGKMAFGLKIVQKNGQAPDIAVAARRWFIDGGTSALALIPIGLGRWLSIIAVVGIGVYQLTLLFSDPRQEDLYDKLGDTYVVKK